MSDISTNSVNQGPAFAAWTIAEYTQHERNRRWYWTAGIIATFLLAYAVWTANFLFAVVILLTGIILYVRHNERPSLLMVQLRSDGVQVGEGIYPFKDLKSFWIIYEPPEVKTLYFDFLSNWLPRLPIPLEDEDPVAIRRFLVQYLPEDLTREGEPTSDALGRIFKL